MRRPLRSVSLALVIVGWFGGCYPVLPLDDPDGSPPPWDAAAFRDAGADGGRRFVPPTGRCLAPTGVDLLFVVDNSGSTLTAQAQLVDALPSLVRALINPPDADGDGEPDWLPVSDLNVGVVTTDLGTAPFLVPTCEGSDDGVLRTEGEATPDCEGVHPSFVRYDPGGARTAEQFAEAVGCVARAGVAGCGFEQPLEAALKAVSPAAPTTYTSADYVAPRFLSGVGHGDGVNAGFLRDDTLLGIVVLTDEDDCSVSDADLFNPASSPYGATELGLRCFVHADEALHPVDRYVEGFAALRAGRPDLLALGIIAGVPPDLALSQPTDADFVRALEDPRMQERLDPDRPGALLPSCSIPGASIAFPPRRLLEVARRLTGHRTTVQSLCQTDYTAASNAIARLLGTRACASYME